MRFNCPSCGKPLNVKDELAGKKARCPSCKGVLTVPSAPTETPEPGAARSCPGCGAELGEGVVFCVNCGYDLRTGKRLKAADGTEDGEAEG